jgi:hypothetical protein
LKELEDVVLWVAHVLIRHEDVRDAQASFQLGDWELDLPPSHRSRREALKLADKIATEARERGNFAELARQFSEDPSTRDKGGAFGGITGAHLWSWSPVLDALATMKPGDVSRVVETQFGYHVFHLRPTPKEAIVSGSHIVIAHEQAPWGEVVARGKLPARSREQALALAAQIYERARAAPESFAELARSHSDHNDAARGGDFGTWSTHEANGLYREVDVLSTLAVGEVAPPVDTVFGVQIIRRTPNRPRKEYAMVKLQLRFDTSLPWGRPGSKGKVFAMAREVAVLLRKDPPGFGALQAKYCCTRPTRVVEGRDLPALEAALPGLAVGQIAAEPIEDAAVEYLIPKRLALEVLPARPVVRFDLPSPSQPDLRYLLSRAPGLRKHLVLVAQQAGRALGLPEELSAKLLKQQTLSDQFEGQPMEARLKELDAMERELMALLDATTLQRYRALLNQHFENLVLRSPEQ